jgi:hypothetical protein
MGQFPLHEETPCPALYGLTRRKRIFHDLFNRLNRHIWRRVQNNDDGADETGGTAQLAQRP